MAATLTTSLTPLTSALSLRSHCYPTDAPTLAALTIPACAAAHLTTKQAGGVKALVGVTKNRTGVRCESNLQANITHTHPEVTSHHEVSQ
jgi:hypothetical protein